MKALLDRIEVGLLRQNVDANVVGDLLSSIGGESYFASHPLGFCRMLIGRGSAGPVYLHYWPPTSCYVESPALLVHRHSVPVYSFVVTGELTNSTYSWEDLTVGPIVFLAQDLSRPSAGLRRTEKTGCLKLRSVDVIRAGECYCVPESAFHKTDWMLGKLTASIVLFAGESVQDPLVAAPVTYNQFAGKAYQSRTLNSSATASILEEIATAFGKPS